MDVSPELRAKVLAWVADDPELATSREALALLSADDGAGLSDRFDLGLEFGTAGLRGTLGAGPNRMNRSVVRRTTAGLCDYLEREIPDAKARGLVIGRDGRRGSEEFARDAAGVAMGRGFTVHYLEDLSPTPLTAFAVEDLGAAAGVMVTASHNPPEYNGYKVYWANAAQIIPPHDSGIAAAIAAVESVKELKVLDLEGGRALGLLKVVPPGVESRYLAGLAGLDFGLPADRTIPIVYTPLHGVGAALARRAFEAAGFRAFHVVAAQEKPDGAFPTVRFPNPEEPGAMDLALALAEEKGAELVLANDPDADRLAVAFRERSGRMRMLSGNEIGVLLGHHRLVDDPAPAKDRLVCTTIVSSPLLGQIAQGLGVRYEETLTGFKWIANTALAVAGKTGAAFVFGYEEALGSTSGTVVKDKDGIGAALVCARLAAHLRAEGKTIGDRLDEIARDFGVYVSAQHNATFKGAEGARRIGGIMARLRESPPWRIGPAQVSALRDFQRGLRLLPRGAREPMEFPPSNVLTFDLEGGDRIVARPSGTEPKIKFYFDVKSVVGAGESLEAARARGEARLSELRAAFVALAEGEAG
jgi:phosphomannomutase